MSTKLASRSRSTPGATVPAKRAAARVRARAEVRLGVDADDSHATSTTRDASRAGGRPWGAYKMKDLCAKTGLDRQTIHFYIAEGLLSEGRKTARNMAWYDDAHLERLLLIRKLQRERLLPLKAIRAVLAGEDAHFDADQRALLTEVKALVRADLRVSEGEVSLRPLAPLLEQHGVTQAEIVALSELGLATVLDIDGTLSIRADDAWLVELWANLRAAGFTEALGFGPADLAPIESHVSSLFEYEARLLTQRVTALPPERVAELVRNGLPLITRLIANYHMAKAREFFARLL